MTLIELTDAEDQLLMEAGFESYYDWPYAAREALSRLIQGHRPPDAHAVDPKPYQAALIISDVAGDLPDDSPHLERLARARALLDDWEPR